ncbi:MAG: hypothetical protein M3214_06640 [Actinomycetota bacterium]|nr:hypothetical protein [Actinomycetota bacterium]
MSEEHRHDEGKERIHPSKLGKDDEQGNHGYREGNENRCYDEIEDGVAARSFDAREAMAMTMLEIMAPITEKTPDHTLRRLPTDPHKPFMNQID